MSAPLAPRRTEGKTEDRSLTQEALWRVLDVQLNEDLRYQFLKKNVYIVKKDTVKPKRDLARILRENEILGSEFNQTSGQKASNFQKYIAKRVELLSRTQSTPDFSSRGSKNGNTTKVFPKKIKIERPRPSVNVNGTLEIMDMKNANTRIVTYRDLTTNLNRDVIMAENYIGNREFNTKSNGVVYQFSLVTLNRFFFSGRPKSVNDRNSSPAERSRTSSNTPNSYVIRVSG
jgi:hypothetical protein